MLKTVTKSYNESNLQRMTRLTEIYIFEKKIPEGCLPLPQGYIHVYDHYFQKSFPLKEIYLSKAHTCMIFSCVNKKMLLFFYLREGYLWPHCCMNNIYITHRSLYAPTYSFKAIGSMLISLFRVTSWFDTVCNIVTRWVKFRENHLHEHKIQLSDYDI